MNVIHYALLSNHMQLIEHIYDCLSGYRCKDRQLLKIANPLLDTQLRRSHEVNVAYLAKPRSWFAREGFARAG